MKVEVIGLGYIGLPILLSFCNKGLTLIGMDNDIKKIDELKSGHIKTLEPDLDSIYLEYGNQIEYSTKVKSSDFYIITVPTPYNNGADISMVLDAVESVLEVYEKDQVIIVESTLPPFAMDKIDHLISSKINIDYNLVYCPESILPGKILYELQTNSRIVGVNNHEIADRVIELYKKVNTKGDFKVSNYREAELYKLIQNAHRDVEIAFVNEVSMFCKDLDVDLEGLLSYANKHPRTNLLQPGVGVGGHCIAVDPYFLIEAFDSNLLRSARETNLKKTDFVIEIIKQNKDKKIGLLGMAYKANSDDLRESPSLKVYYELLKLGFEVYACEPNLCDSDLFENYKLDELMDKIDVFYILQNHNQFKNYYQHKKRKYF